MRQILRRWLLPLLSTLLAVATDSLAVAAPTVPQVATVPAASVTPVIIAGPTHAGYPTTREKWRYCPRDGSHQCVDLDIPGVTGPEQATSH